MRLVTLATCTVITLKMLRGELTDPAKWSAPGWYWLATVSPEGLLRAAQAIGRTGQTEGAIAYVRIASLIGSGADIAGLASLIKGPFSRLRKLAEDTIECIASLADNTSIEVLRKLTRDEHPLIRRAAAKAIGYAGTLDDLTLLQDMADDEYPHAGAGGDTNVREAVAEAIGRLGHRDGLLTLRKMASDKDRNVCCEVAQAVERIGDPEGLELLPENEVSAANQRAIARAYVELATHHDVTRLRELARDAKPIMQIGAAWVCGARRSRRPTIRAAR